MQYIKLGPVRIPYQVKVTEDKKICCIAGLRIPFSSYTENNKKYYKLFGIRMRLPMRDKVLMSQSKLNYLMKDCLESDETIQQIATKIFKEHQGYDMDWNNPKTMNQKIFWLKLNYHDPLVTRCCDKYAVKEYVEEKLGPGFTIPTIAAWEKPEDIDFSVLPAQYVMKVNWSSGYNIIVKDSSTVNQDEVRKQIAIWMQPEQNSYFQTFNWGYKHMKPVVYAEEYMEQIDGQLYDYKFYCSQGKAKFLFIATDRASKETLTYDFFDMDFNKLPFYYGGKQHAQVPLKKPKFFDEMVRCAEKLAEPFPFVRVDFYETGNNFYVGEMTFYSGGGILAFDPIEWDYKLGENIDLSKLIEERNGK